VKVRFSFGEDRKRVFEGGKESEEGGYGI